MTSSGTPARRLSGTDGLDSFSFDDRDDGDDDHDDYAGTDVPTAGGE
jgi:hypothetical protein